jgi:transketolase
LSAGSALAAQIEGGSRRTYCLLSDAELNEGSVWEAIMFAGHRTSPALDWRQRDRPA